MSTSSGARVSPNPDRAPISRHTHQGGEAGRQYLVNGQKIWTTLAQYADWIFCLVRTIRAKAQEGISFLLIDMKTPGITVRPIVTIDGGREVNEVFFDNVEVPAENLVGQENKAGTTPIPARQRAHRHRSGWRVKGKDRPYQATRRAGVRR